jgi:hypothetical protein
MQKVHKVDFGEAAILMKVLSLNEAERTIEEYNKNFALLGFFPKEKGNTNSVANGDATASKDQPDQPFLKTNNKNTQTEDKNKTKKFKCVKCHLRSNWQKNVLNHFKIKHRQVPFNPTQCVQVLDEVEAARTFAAYEKKHAVKIHTCKPYKCGQCEYRAAYKYNAYYHMQKVHKVDSYEAKRLVEVLSLDEAQKTVLKKTTIHQ